MNDKQAIQLIKASDLSATDKERLVQLVESQGWNDLVRLEITSALKAESDTAKNQLDSVNEQLKSHSHFAAEEQQIVEAAKGQMDQAVSDYNLELAKLEQEADQLKIDAKKAD